MTTRNAPLLLLAASLLSAVVANAQTGTSGAKATPGAPAPAPQKAEIDPRSKSVVAGTSFLLPKPIFPVSARKDATYTVEYVFNYAKYDYAPAVSVATVKKADASYATPEQAFSAFFSAIQATDYDWMLNSWDADSKKFLQTSNEKKKQGSSYWVGLWKQRYVGKKIEMVQRIESGLYVLILYKVSDPATGAQIERDTVNFILQNKRWVATQALAADPFAVTYPELKPERSDTVLLHNDRKAPDPDSPFIVESPSRDGAQQLFLTQYPKSPKDGVKVIER